MIKPILLQLHWQFKDHTEFVAQHNVADYDTIHKWIKEVQQRHPLPSGAQWMACNEDSKYFVKTKE